MPMDARCLTEPDSRHAVVSPAVKGSRTLCLLAVAGVLACSTPFSAALAETVLYRTLRVQTGKPNRVAVYQSLKADCSRGPLAEIRVKKMPGHGTLVVRRGSSKRSSGPCAAIPAPAQAIFYQSRDGFSGQDQIEYEVVSGKTVERHTVSIMVEKTAPPVQRTPDRRLDDSVDI
ncbi:conserved hypothetical protein [Hyphomicrobiales bacterium]|nr:conserved hypothetical protein [Hyphomicrobiales bacterium]CAH1674609.1 conserved hypothetical protein [Hyphomicrobiales bacterium]